MISCPDCSANTFNETTASALEMSKLRFAAGSAATNDGKTASMKQVARRRRKLKRERERRSRNEKRNFMVQAVDRREKRRTSYLRRAKHVTPVTTISSFFGGNQKEHKRRKN